MPKALRHAVQLLLVAALAAAPGRTEAAPRATPASKPHRVEAARLMRAKQYDAAIAEYERALALGADPTALFDLAQAHRGAGHPDKALLYLQLFARLSPRSPLRFMVKAQMAELEGELARRAGSPAEIEAAVHPETAPGRSGDAASTSESAARITPPELAAPAPAEPAAPPPAAAHPPALASAAKEAAAVAAAVKDERPPPALVTPPAPEQARSAQGARARSTAEIAAAALILGGSALIGAGAGATIWGKVTEARTEQALAPNPALDDQAHAQSAAGAACAIGGVMATLIGGGILWRQRAPQVSVAPTAGGAQASIGLRF